jgi:hypothetical protein
MNHLVFLDAIAAELGKTLGGVKTMLVKIFDSAQTCVFPVNSGDSLYLLFGIYGIHVLIIVTLLVLRDLISRGKGDNLSQPAPTPIETT